MGIPGDNLWWYSIIWNSEGNGVAVWRSVRGGIPKHRSRDNVAFPIPTSGAVEHSIAAICRSRLRRYPSRWISGSLESDERDAGATTDDKHYVNAILCHRRNR